MTPERKFLTMETPFMESYVQLLIHTCHRRGAFAMGGMAAQIPVKNNPKLAAAALESVKKDKVTNMVGVGGAVAAGTSLYTVLSDLDYNLRLIFIPESKSLLCSWSQWVWTRQQETHAGIKHIPWYMYMYITRMYIYESEQRLETISRHYP